MVTLVADCEPQPPVLGQGPRFISTGGLIVLGTQDLGEENFEVGGSVIRKAEAEGRWKFYTRPGLWKRDWRRGVSCLLPGSWEEGLSLIHI